jgi:hypothetical protein
MHEVPSGASFTLRSDDMDGEVIGVVWASVATEHWCTDRLKKG